MMSLFDEGNEYDKYDDDNDGDDDGVGEHRHLRPSELGEPDTILVWLAAGA